MPEKSCSISIAQIRICSFRLILHHLLMSTFEGETAPADADCKQGYTLFRDSSFSVVGCYKFFSGSYNWTGAVAQCQSESGNLAAVRTQSEHAFLLGLAGGSPFWIAATSSAYGAVAVWTWKGYNMAVTFNSSWVTLQNWDYSAEVNKVILDGNPGAFSWQYQDPSTGAYSYMCRKIGV